MEIGGSSQGLTGIGILCLQGPVGLKSCVGVKGLMEDGDQAGSLVLHMPLPALCLLHVPQVPGSGACLWR